MTEYEVKCLDTWAWYPAYVHDYDSNKKKLYIAYPDDWKQPTFVSPENVRRPPEPMDLETWNPQLGEEVECQAKAEENEQQGWWGCKIKSYASDNKYCVSFDGWGNEHNVTLQKELLRPKNRKKTLTSRNIEKTEVYVKSSLVPWVKDNPPQLADLRALHEKLIHMNFNPETSKIILIAPKNVLTSVKSIVTLHLFKQESLKVQEQKTLAAENEMERHKKIQESASRASFPVHPLLTGYCCGIKRQNFEKVLRESRGQIYSVNIENGKCCVLGKSQEAVDRAVSELKVVTNKIILTRKEVAFLIGSQGDNIRKIKQHAQLLKIVSKKYAYSDFNTLKEKAIRSELKRIDIRERRNDRNNRNNNFQQYDKQYYDELEKKYRGLIPKDLLNSELDDFFNEEDIIDLCEENTPKKYKDDFIVLIGKEYQVNLCVAMIELCLKYLRKQKSRDQNIRETTNKIKELKGLPPLIDRTPHNDEIDQENKDTEFSQDINPNDTDFKENNDNNNNTNNNNNDNNDSNTSNKKQNQTTSKGSKRRKRKKKNKNRSNVPDTNPN